ncbi:MAG: hypothetical protein ACP5IV_07705 [Caldisericia bacterium]
MIEPKTIDKIQRIVNEKLKERLPKYFDIYEFLVATGFKGEKFLSANNGREEGNFVVYSYYSPRFNVEVDLYFNKIKNDTNASIFIYDYDIFYEKISLGKLVKIIKEMVESQ